MVLSSDRKLSGFPSLFLDSVRFLAAFIVLITHARAVWFPESELDQLPSNLSHGAVVVFFVLSGFVIAHTTTHNNRGPIAYVTARLGRLYSVFLPAMIITAICFFLVKQIDSDIFAQYSQNNNGLRFLLSLIFCNEIWFFTSAPIINGPIWSLSYEFWFYVIFGSFFFRTKGIKGLILPITACAIAGPKILLLMLMWLAGWLVYRLPRPRIRQTYRWIIMMVLLFIAGVVMIYLPSLPNEVHTTRMHWADKFLSDFVVSLFIATIFYLLPDGDSAQVSKKIVTIFRKIADLTFPIYVLHFPLLVLTKCILVNFQGRVLQFSISLILVFFLCCIIGFFLENKRKVWDQLFKKTLDLVISRSKSHI